MNPAANSAQKSSLEEDYAWVREAQKGSTEAVSKLYQKYHTRLIRYLYRFCGDVSTAEDLAQETFVKVVQNLPRFKFTGSVLGWIYQIGKNLSLNRIRSSKVSKEVSLNQPIDSSDEGAPERQDMIASSMRDPAELTQQRETLSAIEMALLKVSPSYREVLILCDIEGYAYKEAAELLKCSINTVASRLSRGREQLAKSLKKIKQETLE